MIHLSLPLRTKNPMNNSQGTTRGAMFAAAKVRKAQRYTTFLVVRPAWKGSGMALPVKVTLTRVAPSNGLDPIDGLGASLKSIIDGVADSLGCPNDRTPLITWVVEQRRGKPREYGVEIRIEGRV